MDSKELQITMAKMGVPSVQIARWLKVAPVTVMRWRQGKIEIPGPAALAIKALATGWRP